MKSSMRCLCNGKTWRLHLGASITALGHVMGGGPAAPIITQVPIGTLWPESKGPDQDWSPVIEAAQSTLSLATTQGVQVTKLHRLEPQQQTPA